MLTKFNFDEAPTIVKILAIQSAHKQPVSGKMVDEAIEKHPEYFPDEIEHRRKWDLVPEEVHKAYFNDYMALLDEFNKLLPAFKGLLYCVMHPEEKPSYGEYSEIWEKTRNEFDFERKEKELHNKYFSQYGLSK